MTTTVIKTKIAKIIDHRISVGFLASGNTTGSEAFMKCFQRGIADSVAQTVVGILLTS